MVLTRAAAVGWNHQVISVLHDILPVDGVSMAQQLILVHIHTSVQNF